MSGPTISAEDASRLIRGVLELCAEIIPREHQVEFFAGLREELVRQLEAEERPSRPHLRAVEVDPD